MATTLKVGEKVRCIVGPKKPGNTQDHDRGGAGWQLGKEFAIEIVRGADETTNYEQVVFYNNGSFMVGVYADWVELIIPRMGDMADNRQTKNAPKDILRGTKWQL